MRQAESGGGYAQLTRSEYPVLRSNVYGSSGQWVKREPKGTDLRAVAACVAVGAVAVPGPVSRRGFLGRLGLAVAGALAASLPALVPPPEPEYEWVAAQPQARALTEEMMRGVMEQLSRSHRQEPVIWCNERTIELLRAEVGRL